MNAQDNAEVIALKALGWLAEADLLDAFQGSTGADQASIRAAASDPAFLGAVLDFVVQRDDWVLDAAQAQDIAPEALVAARAALPGGELPHWT